MTRKLKMSTWHLSLLCILSTLRGCAIANMNLYLPEAEVKALFGADNMQLYYIRNGVFNNNAINFKAHVQSDKSILQFVWKATHSDINVLYELNLPIDRSGESSHLNENDRIASEMRSMVEKPSASINMSGKLPNKEEKFNISLRCTGEKDGEVTVHIVFKFRFADNPTKETVVGLKRLKKCLKNDKPSMGVDIGKNNVLGPPGDKKENVSITTQRNIPEPDDNQPETYEPSSHSNAKSTYAFYISISVVTFLIIMVVILVRVWHARSSRKQAQTTADSSMMINIQNSQYLRPDLPNNATAQQLVPEANASWMHFTPIINDLGIDIVELRSKLSSIAVPMADVVLEEMLQEGTFSRIYRGVLEGNVPVLIKTVTSAASEEQTRLLLYESSLLRGMYHRNLLPIKNVVLDGPEPPLVLFPYTKGGNLKRYLWDIKLTDKSNCGTFSNKRRNYEQASTLDLVEMGIHVACGMSYLSKWKLVHKDVATRNCVIDSDLKVKISDNALSRDLFPADYCCLGDNENRPVRWLAMESLIHKVYSTASDVWSFGVLLWELQSLAATPYNDIDDFEMSVYLRDGFRLSQPVNCPDHLYNIMARCWHYSSDKRPTFSQLLQMLKEFYAELGQYV